MKLEETLRKINWKDIALTTAVAVPFSFLEPYIWGPLFGAAMYGWRKCEGYFGVSGDSSEKKFFSFGHMPKP